jgi:hypothetical protein
MQRRGIFADLDTRYEHSEQNYPRKITFSAKIFSKASKSSSWDLTRDDVTDSAKSRKVGTANRADRAQKNRPANRAVNL